MALVLGVMILKRMRPVTIPGGDGGAFVSTDRVRALTALSEQARENPEALANVVSAWLGDATQEPGLPRSDREQSEIQEPARAA